MSRLRSARGAKPATGTGTGKQARVKPGTRTSTRPPGGGVYVSTPRSDVYVALLGVALGALILGCLFLVLELNRYGFQIKAAGLNPSNTPGFASVSSVTHTYG